MIEYNPMIKSFLKNLPTVFMALWLLAFAWVLKAVVQNVAALSGLREKTEVLERALQEKSKDLARFTKDIESRSKELESILGIVNLVPEDRKFLRTQKVVTEEVASLRRKVSRWVGADRVHIVVDTRANKLYLKQGLNLLMDADCSVGRGGTLKDKVTGRTWEFVTPLGEFRVLGKIENPVWTKPDWAFVESKEPIPPPGDPKRRVEGELGAYVLNLGSGYLIHGTRNEALLGSAVSHGCVRLGAEDLKKLYEAAPIGTKVYIF